MQKRFNINKLIALITICVIGINLVLPFLAVYQLPNHTQINKLSQNSYLKKVASLFDGKILLCTSAGFKWIDLDDLSKTDPDTDHKQDPHIKCPLCVIQANGLKNYHTAHQSFDVQLFAHIRLWHHASQNQIVHKLSWRQFARPPPILFA